MRTLARGLPLLITLFVAAGIPAAAVDEGDADVVVDDAVEVIARATVPGPDRANGSGGGEVECVWRVKIADDFMVGVFAADGVHRYANTGRWLEWVCDGEPTPIGGVFLFPEGGGFSAADLLEQARDAIDPPAPAWSASPDGVAVPMVVQLPTWLWIDASYWNRPFAARAVTPSGRIWADATATPVAVTWAPGDGSTVACAGPGTPWNADSVAGGSSCSHTYRHSTDDAEALAMSVTVTFEVWGSTSLDPAPQPLGSITRTAAPVSVRVSEVQALETNR